MPAAPGYINSLSSLAADEKIDSLLPFGPPTNFFVQHSAVPLLYLDHRGLGATPGDYLYVCVNATSGTRVV